MDSDKVRFETETRPFCYCGQLATKKISGSWFCKKHNSPKKERTKIGDYSGKSNSVNKFNDYQ